MLVVGIDGVKSLLREHPSWNYIAFAISQWHALGISASLRKLSDCGVSLDGAIFVVENIGDRRTLERSDFSFPGGCHHVFPYEATKRAPAKQIASNMASLWKVRQRKHANGQRFYILNTAFPDLSLLHDLSTVRSSRSMRYVIVDEGLGTYTLSSSLTAWVNSKYQGDVPRNKVDVMALYCLGFFRNKAERHMISLLENMNKITYNTVLDMQKAPLEINDGIIPYYLSALSSTRVFVKEVKSNTVVFCIDPVDPAIRTELFCIYSKIVLLLKSHGYNVLIKVHPIELGSISEYRGLGCEVIENQNAPFESMIANHLEEIVGVIGVQSSCLVNSVALYGIPSMSLLGIISRSVTVPRKTQKEFELYRSLFSEIIFIPESIGQMLDWFSDGSSQ